MWVRRLLSALLPAAAFAGAAPPVLARQVSPEIVLATTTITNDTGLLDSLLPMFTRQTGIRVRPVAVGIRSALEMARRGEADALLVHAPQLEASYVASGDLGAGRRIMYGDYLIVGPAADPADARARDALSALRAIAEHGSFVSRVDGSCTAYTERTLWAAAGVPPGSVPRHEVIRDMTVASLDLAERSQSYTLAERTSWLRHQGSLSLVPLVEGDTLLRNVYHAYVVGPANRRTSLRSQAERFVRFLTEPQVQSWIGRFGRTRYGRPIFVPDAESIAATVSR